MRNELFNYQKQAVQGILDNAYYGLLIPCGDGKTLILLESIKLLMQKKEIKTTLIIAPLRVLYNVWQQEAEKWGYDFTFHIQHGKTYSANPPNADIYLTTPEHLLLKNFALPITDLIVFDESTKFKNHTSKRFKVMRKNICAYKRRIISTGTPAPKGYLNLFSQVFLLDEGESLGKYITHYKNEYFYPSGYGGYTWEIKDDSPQRIINRIKKFCIFTKSTRSQNSIKYNTITLKGSPEFYELYKEFKRNFCLDMETGTVIAKNAACMYGKLRQLSTGACYLDNETTETFHTMKIDALKDLVAEMQGNPLLVAYNYWHEYFAASKAFKHSHVICGKTSLKSTVKIIEKWNKGEIPVLFAQPQAMAHGLNLQAGGHNILWYSLTNDLEMYHQFNDRLNRIGQKDTVYVHSFIVENTLESLLLQTLIDKDNVQKALLNRLRTQ